MPNKRVIAIQSLEDGVLKTYGEGEITFGLVPDVEPFKELGVTNPCIKLDTGKHVWGFECWWGDVDKFRAKYADAIESEEIVDVENEVLPMPTESGDTDAE